MNKKVGIVSCYFKKNYGSALQAYATQKILDNLSIENETIDITNLNKEIGKGKRKYYLSQIFNISFIKTKIGMLKLKLRVKILRNKLGKNIAIRNKKFEEFQKNFKMSKPYTSKQELTEACADYTDLLVGSDQLWLPVNIVADYYTLNFVPDNINKISYATSFGISSVPRKYEGQYKKFLSRINYLSVREESGKKLVKQLVDRTAQVVCDPTLLLNADEWKAIEINKRIIKDKYILCYFLGKSIEHRKFAERLRQKTGYKIVSINHCDEYVKYSDVFADEIPYDIGPSEFLNLIQNAEYVCTDSFHGTVFSLINQKEFYVFRRYNNKSKMSTNSRIDSLLHIVGLEDRLLHGTEQIEDIMKAIEYEKVNKKIEVFRNESKEFLKSALKINE